MRRVPRHDSVHVTGQIDYGHDAQARVECRQLRAAVVGGRRATSSCRLCQIQRRPTEHRGKPRRQQSSPHDDDPDQSSQVRSHFCRLTGQKFVHLGRKIADGLQSAVSAGERRASALHQLHQRLRTTMDILGHEPKMRPHLDKYQVATGRCMRLRISSIAADHHALRVPFMANTSGPSRLTMDNRNPAQGLCPARVMSYPSSRSNTRASSGPRLRDGSRTGHEVVGHQGAGTPSRRRRRRSRPGVGGPARSARWVLQLDPLPQTCSETSSPTRRDTRFRPPSCGKPIPLGVSDGAVGAAFKAGARETRSGGEMATSRR
jgi:hypothetical protein